MLLIPTNACSLNDELDCQRATFHFSEGSTDIFNVAEESRLIIIPSVYKRVLHRIKVINLSLMGFSLLPVIG